MCETEGLKLPPARTEVALGTVPPHSPTRRSRRARSTSLALGLLSTVRRASWLGALQPGWRMPLQRYLLPQAVADACVDRDRVCRERAVYATSARVFESTHVSPRCSRHLPRRHPDH